jgi:hypothetical protein
MSILVIGAAIGTIKEAIIMMTVDPGAHIGRTEFRLKGSGLRQKF